MVDWNRVSAAENPLAPCAFEVKIVQILAEEKRPLNGINVGTILYSGARVDGVLTTPVLQSARGAFGGTYMLFTNTCLDLLTTR